MESKNLIIACVWMFVLASVIMLTLEDFGLTFAGYLIFFFIALTSTIAVEVLIPEKKQPRSELMSELQNISSRLDELTKGSG